MAIDSHRDDFDESADDVLRLRDCIAGQRQMQLHRELYLRRPEGMTDDREWRAYADHTPFFEATGRTLEGLTGMAFVKDPTLDVADRLKPLTQDMTLDGVDIYGVAKQALKHVVGVNRVGALVDFPPADPNVRNRRDEERQNRRPFVRLYPREAVFNWRSAKVRNARQLVEVRIKETEIIRTAEFEVAIENRIRLLELTGSDTAGWVYRQRVFVEKPKGKNKTEWVEDASLASTPVLPDGSPFEYIPFWFCNSDDLTDALVKPPLLGLANANVAHFNTSAMLERVLSFVGAPQPYVIGVNFGENDPRPTIGSSEAWLFNDPNVQVGYLSCPADGTAALERRLDTFEHHMALLGARMLSADKKGVEAAETAAIHRQGEISVLAACCNSVSALMSSILRVMAEWAALPVPGDDCFKIDTKFFAEPMAPEAALNLVKVWQSGAIGFSDMIAKLRDGQVVAKDRSADDVKAEIQSSGQQPLLAGVIGTGGA